MTAEPAATDFAVFLELAVREQMLTLAHAKDLAKRAARSKLTPGQFCVEAGRLSPIQAEAIEGVLSPQSVADGYEVVGILGHGGIGIVYRARQPNLDRIVALKTISTSRLCANTSRSRSTAVSRFQQEALAIAKLKHPNIVTAFDYGATVDRVYLAMEMVDGIDLDSYIKHAGQLNEIAAWQIARQVAAALAHALESGIVHRDIKPANLLVTDPPAGYPLPAGTPLVKVTDFGLARLNTDTMSDEETRLTLAGSMMGTPHYMAPEQVEDPNVGFEADIYALGATVYHMIAGEPPLAGMSVMKIFAAKLSGEEESLNKLPEEVNQPSRELLSAMMAHKPNQRPQTYGELLTRIGQVLQDETMETAAAIAPAISTSPLNIAKQVPDEPTLDFRPAPRASSHKTLWFVAAGGAALLAVVAAFWRPPWKAGSPPTPRYVANTSLNAFRSLYRGRSITGWQGVARAPDGGDYAGMLRVLGNARMLIEEARQKLPSPDHFGLTMQVALEENDALEVWFESGPDGKINTLLIENNRITLGHRASDRDDFIADGEPVELVRSSIAPDPVLRIDRDERYWLIRQSVPGEAPPPRLLAWTLITADPPSEIRFKADGDSAYIGEIELVVLERIAKAETRPSEVP